MPESILEAVNYSYGVLPESFDFEASERRGEGYPVFEHPRNPVYDASVTECHLAVVLCFEFVAAVFHVFDYSVAVL